jgi:hypothetical protein
MNDIFTETHYEGLIRSHTKLGWRDAHAGDLPRRPKVTAGNDKIGYRDVPAPADELQAYDQGYAEGLAAKAAGIPGDRNPYNLANYKWNLDFEPES